MMLVPDLHPWLHLALLQAVVDRSDLGDSLLLSLLVLSFRVAQPPLRSLPGAERSALRWTRSTTLRIG